MLRQGLKRFRHKRFLLILLQMVIAFVCFTFQSCDNVETKFLDLLFINSFDFLSILTFLKPFNLFIHLHTRLLHKAKARVFLSEHNLNTLISQQHDCVMPHLSY